MDVEEPCIPWKSWGWRWEGDLTPLESSLASIVTVPAEDEDSAEKKNFPAFKSDHSTEDEGGIDASGLSGSAALAQLEDGVKQLYVNRNSKDEDSLQPIEDFTKESPWSFDPWVNRMEPSWNHWSEELDIPDTTKKDVIICLYRKIHDLQVFIENWWRNYPWKHQDDKVLMDGLEDISVMIFKIKRLDQTHDPK